ncbi:MAG: Uma2 family endonuclease [Rhizobiales bacterium]|nr:Uma2 family endonuclease [Hyphomicrobiales bacterium]
MSEVSRDDYRMTAEAFHAFLADRPDWEKWELIDGEAIVQATPTKTHQIVIGNLIDQLYAARRENGGSWQPLIGIGTRVRRDAHNEVVPDVMIMPPSDDAAIWTFDVLAAFEVLSPGSVRRDMVRKRDFYTRIESLTHYVVLAQDRREATVFARLDTFEPRRLSGGDARIEIPPLGISLALSEVYRDTRVD